MTGECGRSREEVLSLMRDHVDDIMHQLADFTEMTMLLVRDHAEIDRLRSALLPFQDYLTRELDSSSEVEE